MKKKLELESYIVQKDQFWPKNGKHIIAQYDEESIIVYQAYNPQIAQFVVKNQTFENCPGFSPTRMTWIKTNFLWMMFRSGWATKPNQERILAIWMKRESFEDFLSRAVVSSFREDEPLESEEEKEHKAKNSIFQSKDEWKQALQNSDVRLQFDPDHSPLGGKEERRAIQIGLRGPESEKYVKESILQIKDVTEFSKEQYELNVKPYIGYEGKDKYEGLITPKERIYEINDPEIKSRIFGC